MIADPQPGDRISYHKKGQRAALGTIECVNAETFYGRTVYTVNGPTGTENVSRDRIIGIIPGNPSEETE